MEVMRLAIVLDSKTVVVGMGTLASIPRHKDLYSASWPAFEWLLFPGLLLSPGGITPRCEAKPLEDAEAWLSSKEATCLVSNADLSAPAA